jgi:hypothetical protein
MPTPPKNPKGPIAATSEVLDVYSETGSYQETANRLGLGYDAVRKRVKRAGFELDFPTSPNRSVLYDEDGNVKLVWAKGGREARSWEELLSEARSTLKPFRRSTALKTALKGPRDLCALFPIVDLHTGLRVWGHECDGPDWDLSIAERVIHDAYARLVARTPKVNTAYILGMGDLLHADNYSNQTGTPGTAHVLDVDGRYPKTLRAGRDVCIDIVELAANVAEKIVVRILPGNHDVQSSVAIAVALESHYSKSKNVTVDISPSPHWVARWGQVMLAASHGDKLKADRMDRYFANAHAETWGASKWRHFFAGHIHKQTLMEPGGCTVETLGTPIPSDSYAASHGFCSSRYVQNRVYSKAAGEYTRITEPVYNA